MEFKVTAIQMHDSGDRRQVSSLAKPEESQFELESLILAESKQPAVLTRRQVLFGSDPVERMQVFDDSTIKRQERLQMCSGCLSEANCQPSS